MPHTVLDLGDVPPPVVVYDRRRTPDRRNEWRGGRRDSDWVNRPPDALARLERHARLNRWRKALVRLHLW